MDDEVVTRMTDEGDGDIDELLALDWGGLTLAGAPDDPASPPALRDRIGGMLLGVAVGDALGAPHEFRNAVPLGRYTGRLEHPVPHGSIFRGVRTGAVAMVTDDTEMTIALADSIVADPGGYDADRALAAYVAWAGTRPPFMGRNTRALFNARRPSVAEYQARRVAAPPSEGNGCLMRCAPLAVLPDWRRAAAADCAITNPNPNSLAAVAAQVAALHALLGGATPAAATALALAEAAAAPPVAAAIAAARSGAQRDVTGPSKGWVVNAIYCAFYALNREPSTPSYQDRIDEVVRRGGDTDTNAAIAGALLGARLGVAAMLAEPRTGPNVAAVLGCDTRRGEIPRPDRYAARRLPALAELLGGRHP